MPAQLPLELLTAICDMVAKDIFDCNIGKPDTTTLRHCALVCPGLTVHCQKHLFSHIQIRFHNPRVISNLQQVLDDHPKLGLYTKTLSVIFRPYSDTSHPGLARILGRFTQVTHLTVGRDRLHFYCNVDWDLNMPKNVQLAMESIIHSPTCKTLDFDGFWMPFSAFSSSRRNTSLESLSFSMTDIGLWEIRIGLQTLQEAASDKIQDQGPSYSSLRFLSLVPSLIPALLSPTFHDGRYLFDMSNLGTLWVDLEDRDVQANVTAQLLRRTTRLQTLGLKLRSRPPNLVRDVFSEPAPCFATTLSEIRLGLMSEFVCVGDLSNKDLFVGTLDGLRAALSGRNVLRIIYIEMVFDLMWWDGKIVQERWLRAATTFRDPGSFPLVQEFTVDVTTLKMLLSPEEMQEGGLVSGEQHAEDLLDIPFHTLDLPYKFNFSAHAV